MKPMSPFGRGILRGGQMFAISAGVGLLLAGCGSSPEDQLYEAFKCGKVATLLEQDKEGDNALRHVIPQMQQMEAAGGSPGRFALEMNQRFQDDVPLHRMTVDGQMQALFQVYKSDKCQALYKPVGGSG